MVRSCSKDKTGTHQSLPQYFGAAACHHVQVLTSDPGSTRVNLDRSQSTQ